MGASCFIIHNADTSALTAAPAGAATAATVTVKTMLQIKTGTSKVRVIEWGYALSAVPAAPVQIELVETGTVFATVTTIGSGIRPYNDANGVSQLVAGTSATGFTASAEGTVTATRLFDWQFENGLYYKKQFPLGREPEIAPSSSLRIRATPGSAAAVTLSCFVVIEE